MTIQEFLNRPGINTAGICSEAGVSQQYLLRRFKAGKHLGKKALDKLLPVLKSYGFIEAP